MQHSLKIQLVCVNASVIFSPAEGVHLPSAVPQSAMEASKVHAYMSVLNLVETSPDILGTRMSTERENENYICNNAPVAPPQG